MPYGAVAKGAHRGKAAGAYARKKKKLKSASRKKKQAKKRY